MNLSLELAMKAKELMHGMRQRTGRDPDTADFKAAFEPILAQDAEPDYDILVAKELWTAVTNVFRRKHGQ